MRPAIGSRQSAVVLSAFVLMTGCSRTPPSEGLALQGPRVIISEQSSGTTALLQTVSAVNENVVWVSGHRATWARTTNGGVSWQSGAMTGPDSVLQFRDVHAISADVAYLLAAGPGDRSRIYKTVDGGRSWALQFTNRDSSAFYDCFDFWSARRGVAVSDAVGGHMPILVTDDGGDTWTHVAGVPAALEGEGAFAASGTCLVARPNGLGWIGTGANSGARVYTTRDYGRTWSVVTTPVASGPATGIASVAFRDDRIGLALGGRIAQPDSFSDNVALTRDGGATWTLAARTPFSGAVFGSAFVPERRLLVAVSPKGLIFTDSDGSAWHQLSSDAYWAVGFASRRVGWAVGPGGRISRLEIAEPR